MPVWTKEQELAIYEKGKNIIVSAGAGSGKTAVLSERVLNHLQNGMEIDSLLILTFTKAAAAEMKERIRKKISDNPSLHHQLDKVDNADITTFDAYALKIVKKYNYLLNISKNISRTTFTFHPSCEWIRRKKTVFLIRYRTNPSRSTICPATIPRICSTP